MRKLSACLLVFSMGIIIRRKGGRALSNFAIVI